DAATYKLPNFTCREHIERATSLDDAITWTHRDPVETDVVYSGNEEHYTNITRGGIPWPRGIMDLDGFISSGEYGSVLRDLFRAGNRFSYAGTETLNQREVFIYDYSVDQDHADWSLTAGPHHIVSHYHGRVWIDKSNLWVWKISQIADEELPKDFPWRRA